MKILKTFMSSTLCKFLFILLGFALVIGQLVFLNQFQPTKASDTTTSYYLVHAPISQGQPMVVPPSSWISGKTAKDLCDYISGCDLVSKWDKTAQAWVSFTPALAFTDFPLEVGRGYAVSVTADTLVSFPGSEDASLIIDMPRTSQAIDQYHFTLPSSWIGKRASDLISNIDKEGSVSYYNVDQSGWISYIQAIPPTDFILKMGISYVVQITTSTSFDPRLPDLTIKDIYTGYSGNASTIKVKYCNEGASQPLVSGYPATFYIKMTANSKIHTGTSDNSNYVLQVPKPGECSVTDGYLASYFGLLDGEIHTVTAEADWQKSIAESNETNNVLSKFVELPMYLVGIIVDNITATSATVKWTTAFLADSHIDYVSYGGSIYDIKNAQNTNFVLAHSLTLTGLAPNTTYSYSLTSYDQQGNVYATKSLSSSVLGLNFKTLPGDKPDLMFTKDITVDKSTILPGDMVTLSVDAKNNSEVAVPAGAYLKWYIAGNEYKNCTSQLPAFKAGWGMGIGCTVNNFQDITGDKNTGTVHVQVKIDSENTVVESNESNNKMEKYVYVGGTDTSLACTELRAGDSTKKYFDICKEGSYGYVCFDKHSGEYMGCSKNLGENCTVNNMQAVHNISCSVNADIAPKPDLIVSDFSWSPANPQANQDVTMTIAIKNIGEAQVSDKFWVTVAHNRDSEIVSDVVSGYKEERDVVAGGTILKSFKTKFTGTGAFAYTILIPDTDKERVYNNETYPPLYESNTANNSLTKTINVGPYETPLCADSDGGANYHAKGVCTDALGAHEDKCVAVDASGRKNKCLTEYYCNTKTNRCDQAKGGEFECAFGCSENACIMKKEGIKIPEAGEYYFKMNWYNASERTTISLVSPAEKEIAQYYGYHPPVESPKSLGYFNKGDNLLLSLKSSWWSTPYGPVYSSDPLNFKIETLIESLGSVHWKFTFEGPLRYDKNYNDGSFEIYLVAKEELLKPGDLFKISANPVIYYLGADNKRYVFPYLEGAGYDQRVMDSWLVDKSKIKTVSQSTMEKYAIGGNVLLRPGSGLIKISSDSTVYAVGAQGRIHQVPSDQLVKLYGEAWNVRLVIVPDVFFVNYIMGAYLNNNYPNGTIIRYFANPSVLYLVWDGYKFLLTSEGFAANYKDATGLITTAPESVVYPNGDPINKKVDCLTDIAQLSTCKFEVPVSQPTLTASAPNVSPELSVLAGETGRLFTNIELDAAGSSEDIKVTRFDFIHQASKANIQDYITNIKLYDQGTVISSSVSGGGGGGSNGTAWTTSTTTIVLTRPLVIPKGAKKTLNLRGDVSASAEVGTTHQFNIANEAGILAFGNSSNNTIKVAGNYPLQGILMTIVGAGKITLSSDSANPASTIYNGGSQGVTLGVMKLESTLEDVEITRMTLQPENFNGGALTNVISKLYLYDGNTKIAEAVPVNNGSLTLVISPYLVVAQGVAKVVTLKADLAQVGLDNPAQSGYGLLLKMPATEIVVRGKTSSKMYESSEKQGNYATNRFYLFKSVPVVSKQALASTLQNGNQVLYRFNVSADARGDIGLYKFSFDIGKNNVNLSNFELLEGSYHANLTSSPISSLRGNSLEVLFDTDGDGTSQGGEYRLVPAGSAKTYELKANVQVTNPNDYSLTVKLLSNAGEDVPAPASARDVDLIGFGHFIWSDLSYGNSSSTATTTAEWVNGRLVKGLDQMQSFGGGGFAGNENIVDVQPQQGERAVLNNGTEEQQLRERIKRLELKITELERHVVEAEKRLTLRINTALAHRVRGEIFLQVQEHGEAWYVDPVTEQRFYLKDGESAYRALQAFGLGISDVNLKKIPVGLEERADKIDSDGDGLDDRLEEAIGTDKNKPDTDGDGFNDGEEVKNIFNPAGAGRVTTDANLANQLDGRIVLQVQNRGQAWYIHDGKRFYLKDGDLAYQIMRFLSNGITNSDLRQIGVGALE